MDKKLGKIIIGFIGGILLLAIVFPYQPKVYNLNDVSFSTTSEARLFYNNTRAFYYTFNELAEAGFTVYEFGGTDKTDTLDCINFFIVQNWRGGEAYIMSEPSSTFSSDTVTIGAEKTIRYSFESMSKDDHYQLAASVFDALLHEKEVYGKGGNQPIFGNAENEKANLIVLKDYFRLIGKYQ